MMSIYKFFRYTGMALLFLMTACVPDLVQKTPTNNVPASFQNLRDTLSKKDTTNMADVEWKDFFKDTCLKSLIDTALSNNQELKITLQEIKMKNNEISAIKGEYLPKVDLEAGTEAEKAARYTRHGAVDETTDIRHHEEFPEPLTDFKVGAFASWEVGIWNKLSNSKKAATYRYLATISGRNFMVTQLVAEIARSYYELTALDNKLNILNRNIAIQQNALNIIKQQKAAGRVTNLPLQKFKAEVLKNKSRKFEIQQQITETENRLNYLTGKYPKSLERNSEAFKNREPDTIVNSGVPRQLLKNRPDIQKAKLKLKAAKLDVKVAKARFYPSLDITAGIGYQAFKPEFLLQTPESLMYSLAGDLVMPLINRKAIKAAYSNANAEQIKAAYNYQRTILTAYTEVANQLAKINNLGESYDLRDKQVQTLTKAINTSKNLFQSARADYMEVLMTQRDALESKMELIETQKEQLNAKVNLYQALGGGWN